jgi:chaperone required for assembly of F1-ATPase
MHLTGLCNTCTDNPTKVSKFELVGSILNFLDTDTVLYFAPVNLF